MERWEPWVRAYIAVGEMMQGIVLRRRPLDPATWIPNTGRPESLIAEVGRPKSGDVRDNRIPLVLSWADLRDDRATEVLAQIDPQYAFWSSIIGLHPERTRRTLELVNMVLQFCVYVEMRFKQALGLLPSRRIQRPGASR